MGPVEIEIIAASETRVALSVQYASDAAALRRRWFADRGVLDGVCRDFSEALEESQTEPASEAALEDHRAETAARIRQLGLTLFQELLKEEGDRICEMSAGPERARYIIFKIDRSLAYLPVELMYDGEEFISTRMAMGRVVYSEDAPGRSAPERASPHKVYIAGDPSSDPAIRRDVEGEIDGLRKIFTRSAGFSLKIEQGPDVTRQSMLAHLPGTTVFHFTGHGVATEEDAAAGIKLAGDEVLGGEALSGLKDPPALAFLNMCTPLPCLAWKGALGLVETLLARGTSACVASLWDVKSVEATLLASRFYAYLLDGETFGHALRRARNDLVETFATHSLSWAAYTLYGDPRLSLGDLKAAPAARGRWLYAATAVVAALVLFVALLPHISRIREMARKPPDPPVRPKAKENVAKPPSSPVGYVMIESVPADAEILLDGEARGSTPLSVEIAAGDHHIVLKKQGYRHWEAWIQVKESEKVPLKPKLVKIE